MSIDTNTSWRRLAAFAVDYVVIALYLGLLYLVAQGTGLATQVKTPWQAHLLGFMTLALPVILYFALFEARRGATLGKQVLGLRVKSFGGGRLPLDRSLRRSIIKFLPWELSHAALYRVEMNSEILASWQTVFFSVSLLGAAFYLLELFVPPYRPLYDRVSEAQVSLFSSQIGSVL